MPGGREEWGLSASWLQDFLWGDENVLEPMQVAAMPHRGGAALHWIIGCTVLDCMFPSSSQPKVSDSKCASAGAG